MHKLVKNPSNRNVLLSPIEPYPNAAGNVLIYVVVLMLIFGVLGVAMISLFTSTTASTVTRNDSRRARYMAESGVRYAFSELRNNDFDPDVIDKLNTTTYTLNSPGSFTINVFGPWFESPSDQVINNSQLTLNVPQGELPDNYDVPNNLWVINFEYTGSDTDETYMRSDISNYQKAGDTTLTFDVNGDFNAAEGDRICLGVQPAYTQSNLSEGDDIVVAAIAQDFFPRSGGAININRVDYSYERLVEEGGQIKLKNISTAGFQNTLPAFPLTVENTTDGGGTYNGEFIVLSPRNHTVVPTGTSDEVSYGGDFRFGLNIYDYSLPWALSRKPDISADDLTSNLSEQATDTRFFEVDTVDDELTIGGGEGGEFGSAFFDADMFIGGDQTYCQQGACRFEIGVRAFFLLKFTGQGDGITITLTNWDTNSETSVGGDFELSELIGYAGDSRLDAIGNNFLATDPNDRGLEPPKFAVEFDTKYNNSLQYCNFGVANENTRKDPLPDELEKDVVQYVFWGREDLTGIIPCRDDNATYDDNRHDPDPGEEKWSFNTFANVISSPAVDKFNGTVYVGSNNGRVYAFDPEDGTVKPGWPINTGSPVRSSPAIAADGTIYVGSDNGNIYAFNPSAIPKPGWPVNTGSPVMSSPAIAADGTIYVGSDNGNVYALDPTGAPKPGWPFGTGGPVRSSPAIAADGTIYIGSDDGNMYALDSAGAQKPGWPFNAGAAFSLGHPAIGPDETIYFSAFNARLYARNPDGTEKWTKILGVSPGGDNTYMPGVDPDNGTIYSDIAGNSIVAYNSDGSEKWQLYIDADLDSTPIVGPDGTIYFGSDEPPNAIFAVYQDGTEKWRFSTGNNVDTTPALSPDGSVVYAGSNDNNLYAATNPISQPPNLRNLLLTSDDIGANVSSSVNWLNGNPGVRGPWAVRLEVDRGEASRNYKLNLWIRQCEDDNCLNILGTSFQDTRLDFESSPGDMTQEFTLNGTDHTAFERFYFGFTSARAAGDDQIATISQFQLSFIRPGDPQF